MDVGYVIAQTATHQWILFSVYHSKHRQQRRREQDIVRVCKSEANNLDCARGIVLLKLTTDTHEALRGLSATAELLVQCTLYRAFRRSHVSTSCEMNDRPAELNEIRGWGVLSPADFVDQHRDLVSYPMGDWKPVQFSKNRCDVIEFTGSGNTGPKKGFFVSS